MFKDYYNQARDICNAIAESMQDPQRLHATVVHLPIVLSVLVFIGVVMLIFTLGRSHRLRWGTAVMAFLTAAIAWLATETGEDAEHAFMHDKLSEAAHEALDQHEFFGNYLWVGLLATSLVLMISAVAAKWVRAVFVPLALLTSLATVAWVAAAAHYGGEMVYAHGVGVPATPDNITHLRAGESEPPDTPTDEPDTQTDKPEDGDEPKPDSDADQPKPDDQADPPQPDDQTDPPKPEGEENERKEGTFFDIPTDE